VSNADVKEVIKDRMGVNQIPTWQVWKSKELVDQYVVVTSIDTVPKALLQMVDQHLPNFTLVKEVANFDLDAVDIDSFGLISPTEFESTFWSLGYSRATIREAFSYLDFKAEGSLSRLKYEIFCTKLGMLKPGVFRESGMHLCTHQHARTQTDTDSRSRSCARSLSRSRACSQWAYH